MKTNENVRRKIIVVDDVGFHLIATKERLKYQYEVFPAQSAEELFKLLAKIKPELILLDINMPDIDGYDTITELKSDKRYADIPVIFLTGKSNKEDIVKGMNLGAVDFVKKPFTDAELIERVEYHLCPEKRTAVKPIILAVDDDPSILKSVNYLLNKHYTVYTLSEPEKVKALLAMATPDLFLLDCKMPILSGFDLIPIIREHRDHKETPIVFLTSEGTIDNISVALNLGASDFVVKPIDDDILSEKLALHLKDFEMKRRIRSL